jgi:hypothetical protein
LQGIASTDQTGGVSCAGLRCSSALSVSAGDFRTPWPADLGCLWICAGLQGLVLKGSAFQSSFSASIPPPHGRRTSQAAHYASLARLGIIPGANQEACRRSVDATGRSGGAHTRHRVGSRPRSVGMFAIVSVVLDPLKQKSARPSGGCPSSWSDSPLPLPSRPTVVVSASTFPRRTKQRSPGGRPIPSPPLTSLATPRSGIKLVTVPSSTFFVPSVEPDTSSQLFPPY